MNTPRANSNIKPLLARLPNPSFLQFKARGTNLIRTPIREVFGGFAFQGSQWYSPRRYIGRFVLPLWVHMDFKHLSFGERLRRLLPDGSYDDLFAVSGDFGEIEATIEVMIRDGLPWIEEYIRSDVIWRDDWPGVDRVSTHEVKVMGAVFLRRFDEARRRCRSAITDGRLILEQNEWSLKQIKRIRLMWDVLREGRDEEAYVIVQGNIASNWERFNLHQFD